VNGTDHPVELQSIMGCSVREGGRSKDHRARRTPYLWLAAGGPRRTSRVAMAILRHARFSITMEIYTQVSSTVTRQALKRLGDSLDG
jgi:hypothetical protein